MILLDHHAPSTLEWRQETFMERFYELKGGDTTYGALRFLKVLGSFAEAESSGEPLIEFANHGVLRAAAEMTVKEAARQRQDLAFLALFCWYILLLHMQDSAVVAGS